MSATILIGRSRLAANVKTTEGSSSSGGRYGEGKQQQSLMPMHAGGSGHVMASCPPLSRMECHTVIPLSCPARQQVAAVAQHLCLSDSTDETLTCWRIGAHDHALHSVSSVSDGAKAQSIDWPSCAEAACGAENLSACTQRRSEGRPLADGYECRLRI